MSPQLKNQIENNIKNNKVVIYMKGTAEAPLCGFSARAIQILQSYHAPIKDFNVLSNAQLRQGIKEFTNWPTLPQIFIDGQFIGGCDIISEMHENGELAALLKS